jgi:hypothetical protein
MRVRSTLAAGVILFVLGGCAVGDDEEGGATPIDDATPSDAAVHDSVAKDTGTAPADTGTAPLDSGSATDSHVGPADSGGGPVDTGAPPVDTGVLACVTATAADCSGAAQDLGSISGDTGKPTVTASGSDGGFVRVRITEDDSSLLSSVDLSARIDLMTPGGEDFDLYVYRGPLKADGGGVECTTVHASSTKAGDDSVKESWSDNRPIGGSDDARVLSIEVRPKSLSCDPALRWTLLVSGHV